ncbi:MAG: hypothetical protein ABIH23_24040 [bacterium]|jgi:hypothetical protein
MRQLSVITLVTLVIAAQAFGAAGVATNPPDVRLPVGQALSPAFDLSDYNSAGAGGPVNIAGSATVGVRTEQFTVDGQTVSSTVKVSSALVQNGPSIDPLADPAGNPFVNVLRPGVAANSVEALVGLPGGGSGGSPGGVTTPAWSVTFGTVAVSYNQGLRVRTSSKLAAAPAGLTATIAPNGSYSLTATDAFQGPVLVTFISKAGSNQDGATVLATKGLSVGANYAQNDASIQVNGTAATGFNLYPAVQVGTGPVTVAIDVVPNTNGMAVGLAAVADAATFADFAYVNPTGDTKAGQKVRLRVSYESPTGNISVYVIAAGGNATFSNLKVYKAAAAPAYAIGANELDLVSGLFATTGAKVNGNFNAVTDVSVLSPGQANGATGTVSLSNENNFGASGKSVALGEAGTGFDNISLNCAPASPAMIGGRIWVKGSGKAVFVMTAFNSAMGVGTAIGAEKAVSSANWVPMSINGGLRDASMVWVSVQGVGGGQGSLLVDDMKAMQVMDLDAYFDAVLYGLE